MPSTASPNLLFIHIPRTGGASLINILDDRYNIDDIAPFWNPPDFSNVGSRELRQYKLIRGHCGPNELYKVIDHDYSVITFLRDPVARAASIYRWLRTLDVGQELTDGAEVARGYGAKAPTIEPTSLHAIRQARAMTFEEFLESEECVDFVSNGQTTTLGTAANDVNDGGLATHVDKQVRALGVLDRCLMVGITEKHQESLLLLHYLMRWPAPPMEHKIHDTKQHAKMSEMTGRAFETIRLRNEPDIALYEAGLKRFDSQFHTMQEELGAQSMPDLTEAIDNRFFENTHKCKAQKLPVRRTALEAWSGTGWDMRSRNWREQVFRTMSPGRSATLSVKVDPTEFTGREGALALYMQSCVDMNVATNLQIEANGQRLDHIGIGPVASRETRLSKLYRFSWRLPHGLIAEHNGQLDLSLRLVDVEESARFSLGAYEVV